MLYADDTKIIAKVGDNLGQKSVQEDITVISQWTKTWLMQLNVNKCKVMHLGKRETVGDIAKYSMENISDGKIMTLNETECERDLGVIFSSGLSWNAHIQMITSKAYRVLGQLKNTFTSRDVEL